MTLASYTDDEVAFLEDVGRRRTLAALLDLRQRHLDEDYGEVCR
jgi:hypothetical protein